MCGLFTATVKGWGLLVDLEPSAPPSLWLGVLLQPQASGPRAGLSAHPPWSFRLQAGKFNIIPTIISSVAAFTSVGVVSSAPSAADRRPVTVGLQLGVGVGEWPRYDALLLPRMESPTSGQVPQSPASPPCWNTSSHRELTTSRSSLPDCGSFHLVPSSCSPTVKVKEGTPGFHRPKEPSPAPGDFYPLTLCFSHQVLCLHLGLRSLPRAERWVMKTSCKAPGCFSKWKHQSGVSASKGKPLACSLSEGSPPHCPAAQRPLEPAASCYTEPALPLLQGTVLCDIILLNFLKGADQYKAKKFEEVSWRGEVGRHEK